MSKLLLHSTVTTLRQCSGCVQEIKHDEAYIGCNQCFMWFHTNCVFKSRTAVANAAKLTSWFCSSKCSDDHKRTSNLNDLVQEIQMPDNPTIKDLYQLIIQHMEKAKADTETVRQTISDETINRQKENQHFRNEINFLKQQQINNHILITGIPLKSDSDINNIVSKINQVIKSTANLDHTHIEKVEVSRKQQQQPQQQQHKKHQQQQEWILRVDFYHYHNKKLFLSAFRAHGPLFLCQIIKEQIDAPIFIREELTPYYNKLAYEARKVKKELKFKYCWYKFGKVLLRKTENSKIYSFRSFTDIDAFKLKINQIKTNLNESTLANTSNISEN
jgi:hypothetical protein